MRRMATAPRSSPNRSATGSSAAASPRVDRRGRAPAPGSSTISNPGRHASSGSSTERTRCLACLGLLRGHATVADAIEDPVCRSAVEELWNDAEAALPAGLGVPAYRAALVSRFANPRIEHLLGQIAQDTSTKVRLRIAPVAEVALANGRDARGCAFAVASWIVAQATGLIPGASVEHCVGRSQWRAPSGSWERCWEQTEVSSRRCSNSRRRSCHNAAWRFRNQFRQSVVI